MSVPALDRRIFFKSSLVGGLVALAASTTAGAVSGDLPVGYKRGKISAYEAGAPIYEVIDNSGNIVGYTLSAHDLKLTQRSLGELDRKIKNLDFSKEVAPQNVVACAAGIGAFVVQTVFPAARVARLAWRLGGLVRRYGATTVARIFKGARGIAGRTAEQEIVDIIGALTGIDLLRSCFS